MEEHDMQTLVADLSPVTVSLGKIFLDPNNPRFTTPKAKYIAEKRIRDAGVQDLTRGILLKDFGK